MTRCDVMSRAVALSVVHYLDIMVNATGLFDHTLFMFHFLLKSIKLISFKRGSSHHHLHILRLCFSQTIIISVFTNLNLIVKTEITRQSPAL